MENIKEKRCSKCKKKKSIKEFYKYKESGDGYFYWCKLCFLEKYPQTDYYKRNSKKIIRRIKEWQKNNPGYKKEYYQKNKENPGFKLNRSISVAIRQSLKGNKKGRHWENLVDYTLEDIKGHLETQFKNEMTWENYGRNGWHIDHKIPLSLFNITSVKCKGFKACWSLENLRPMWESENIRKSNKLFY